jgi:hypothetical protein
MMHGGDDPTQVEGVGMLRRVSGPNRTDVTGEWRKLHNEELHNLYPSSNITGWDKSKRIRLAGHGARILSGKPEGYRHRHTLDNNIKMDVEVVDWIHVA